ncbi:ribbon-helix-helix domain-containing protein [Sphingobium yanoikuyae]|uniref:ribbon-helix-helix domain-containing protein n=1 Tax=Sphingobium yanoikuyae TaxID=13690 RepID=UPI0035B1491A
MSDSKDNMVLRTVYLPINLDRELRQLAFSRDVSKADLIRDFIRQGLGGVQQTGEKTLADKIQERIDTREQTISKALVSAKAKKSGTDLLRKRRRAPAKVAAST